MPKSPMGWPLGCSQKSTLRVPVISVAEARAKVSAPQPWRVIA